MASSVMATARPFAAAARRSSSATTATTATTSFRSHHHLQPQPRHAAAASVAFRRSIPTPVAAAAGGEQFLGSIGENGVVEVIEAVVLPEETSWTSTTAAAAEPAPSPSSSSDPPMRQHPIFVFGAGGKTGKRCVSFAAKAGKPVVACTRSGSFSTMDLGLTGDESDFVTAKPGNVSKATQAELVALIEGASAVIFAASSSTAGGNPQDVDRDGLISVARACISAKVPRLVIVSSGSVSKPLSPVYIFLNLFGGIMRAKIEGEDAVRALYFKREGLSYTVVRPGGLSEDEPRGVGAIELNQGDDKSGRISRADVAAICVEAATSTAAANATFECYWADTGKSLGEVGFSNMTGGTSKDDAAAYVSGKERKGATWGELLTGLQPDVPGAKQQGCGFSL